MVEGWNFFRLYLSWADFRDCAPVRPLQGVKPNGRDLCKSDAH